MSGGTWAVLPVKPLRGALRRLTPALDAPVRRELQVAMLTDVLAACAGARELAGVMVVTSDPAARGMAETIAGARVVPDHHPPRGMNAAVVRGREAVAAAFVLDDRDAGEVPAIEALDVRPVLTDALMPDRAARARLAATALEAAG